MFVAGGGYTIIFINFILLCIVVIVAVVVAVGDLYQ